MNWLFPSRRKSQTSLSASNNRVRPRIEYLESRVVPYANTGNYWPGQELVTISFQPDGTDLGGMTSNLQSTFNARFGSAAAWQNQILKAAQTWAQRTNLNFAVVADDGSPSGSGEYQQGDSRFGDVRIGGYVFGNSALAMAYLPPPVNNYSLAGDVVFNTGQSFNIGSTYDLYTVAMHEIGHALGLEHTSTASAVEYSVYNGVKCGLAADDVGGIRSIYSANAGRSADFNDANGGNNSFGTATDVTQHIGSTLTLLRPNRDISTSDVDFFKLTAPAGTTSTVTIRAHSKDLSLLAPKITVYAANQTTILGSANGQGQYGTKLTVTLTNKIAAGQVIYVKVQGADTSALGTGAYALVASFGGEELPIPSVPDTRLANGDPISGGGGVANSTNEYGTVTGLLGDVINAVGSVVGGWLGGLFLQPGDEFTEDGYSMPKNVGCGFGACTTTAISFRSGDEASALATVAYKGNDPSNSVTGIENSTTLTAHAGVWMDQVPVAANASKRQPASASYSGSSSAIVKMQSPSVAVVTPIEVELSASPEGGDGDWPEQETPLGGWWDSHTSSVDVPQVSGVAESHTVSVPPGPSATPVTKQDGGGVWLAALAAVWYGHFRGAGPASDDRRKALQAACATGREWQTNP